MTNARSKAMFNERNTMRVMIKKERAAAAEEDEAAAAEAADGEAEPEERVGPASNLVAGRLPCRLAICKRRGRKQELENGGLPVLFQTATCVEFDYIGYEEHENRGRK